MSASMKVALYARVSKRISTQDTENQLVILREYCARQGWTITTEFVDRKTGKNNTRPQYQAMFDGASRRDFDIILSWALDRMSRAGVEETFADLARLRSSGVAFWSYTEEYFRTLGPTGELLLAVAAWIAKQERIRISERVHAGLARARKQGRVGGRPKLIFNRQEVIDLYTGGNSIRAIETTLNGKASKSVIGRIVKELHANSR